MNYALGRLIETRQGRKRAVVLWMGIGLNLAGLAAFKYVAFTNFLFRVGDPLLQFLGMPAVALKLLPPLGISFFTFKAISYLVDVHRKDVPAERDLLVFATYVAMFPQILAGPIARYADCHGEMKTRKVKLSTFRLGAECFVIGLAQKMLIANTLAAPVNAAFSAAAPELTTSLAWIGAVCYTLQIYFDFAGYTNMAIGLGHMMGFKFPPNFNYPYAAQSITEFWQRWHITLSTWLRDYLWFPLGANRKGTIRTTANLLLVFGICGIWHGAAYTFLVWGLFHGLLLAAERAGFLSLLSRFGRPLRTAYAVTMVMIGWVLFRADSLSAAGTFLSAMAGLNPAWSGGAAPPRLSPLRFLSPDAVLALTFGVLFAFPWSVESLWRKMGVRDPRLPLVLRVASAPALLIIFVVALMAIAAGSHNPFLYFRF
ncbi:MAG: MBOAT family protein [Candidatus Solibacter sp.]|nr:MBOAT family protein [Candidatus Solibacter sp.]